ncbi:hypothetical protein AB4Y45_25845 [Paraburkholderia sp. EG287A]|uniref:hypothetical protein n=1 Tax=unclassified Paraburkholderia TaxID=2615204 RepID=UPI0034D36CC1
MSVAFHDMRAVREAFDACQRAPDDPAALNHFRALHTANQDQFVESFDVGGVTYPRTDGHRLSEAQAREAISKYLETGSPADLNAQTVAIAWPLPDEVLRQEIETVVKIASAVEKLDWRTDEIAASDVSALRELLRMPTSTGSYGDLRSQVGHGLVVRGYDADHLIPDKAMRGRTTLRGDSPTKASGFATFLQDGQNRGSQHKFATDAQITVRQYFATLDRNPTVGEYLERVHVWMTNIYTTADLAVESLLSDPAMRSGADFQKENVKGYAIAQAGFMTWPERQKVGRAIATALLIQARNHYRDMNWDMNRELPLVRNASGVAPPRVQPQPSLADKA